MLSIEVIKKNFENYVNALNELFDESTVSKLIEELGGEERLEKAVFGSTTDSGVAYDGSLIACANAIQYYAEGINNMLPNNKKANPESIKKVALLSHIAKSLMFTENDNSWEKTNRGMIYKFETLPGALRCGERSILIAMNCGVKFTPEEYEAMRIMDKSGETDNYSKFFSSPLSTVIRQANEIITLIKYNKK